MARPLTIYIGALLWTEAWVEELRQKGHTVCRLELVDYDLLLAPQACRFVPGMRFLLDEVVKGARRLKYPLDKRDKT